ncbi:uncharacterized protein LOC143195618 [Rhynchophorus ferrugineus]|uniref:uncharacterized protein LOC143195618 n=1 Tax=Rhynchophorus ferrugineus TaxID=354439 RepID=UPI003FCC946F
MRSVCFGICLILILSIIYESDSASTLSYLNKVKKCPDDAIKKADEALSNFSNGISNYLNAVRSSVSALTSCTTLRCLQDNFVSVYVNLPTDIVENLVELGYRLFWVIYCAGLTGIKIVFPLAGLLL